MFTDTRDANRIASPLVSSIQGHWKFFLVEGISLLILGLVAIVVPVLASVTMELLIGWVLLVSGVLGLVMTLRARSSPGFGWSLVSAFAGLVAGIVLLRWPLSGTVSLTLILSIFLGIEGVVSVLYALDHRREGTERWGYMLFSGVIDLLLAGFILAGLPGTAAWAIGLLVGINLLFGGAALTGMALRARTPAGLHAPIGGAPGR